MGFGSRSLWGRVRTTCGYRTIGVEWLEDFGPFTKIEGGNMEFVGLDEGSLGSIAYAIVYPRTFGTRYYVPSLRNTSYYSSQSLRNSYLQELG